MLAAGGGTLHSNQAGKRARLTRALWRRWGVGLYLRRRQSRNPCLGRCRKNFLLLPHRPGTANYGNPAFQHQHPPAHLPGQSRAASGPGPLVSLRFAAGHRIQLSCICRTTVRSNITVQTPFLVAMGPNRSNLRLRANTVVFSLRYACGDLFCHLSGIHLLNIGVGFQELSVSIYCSVVRSVACED